MVGIKPTRLWYLTSKKYLKRLMDDKYLAVNHPFQQRDKPDVIQFFALNVFLASAVLYSFGLFSPKITMCTGPEASEAKAKKKCPKRKGPLPCPDAGVGPLDEPCPEESKNPEDKKLK